MRLDEDKLEALRRWGEGLRRAGSEESAAAGRAILMLIEEIAQLHAELSHARRQRGRVAPAASDEPAHATGEQFGSTRHEHLRPAPGQDSASSPGTRPEPSEEAGSDLEGTDPTTSPQSWIEALRRQDSTR